MRAFPDVVYEFTDRLIELLKTLLSNKARTFGFEQEFLPKDPLDLSVMEKLYSFIPLLGFERDGDRFLHRNGMYITFEPGGQIEYCSPPLFGDDIASVTELLDLMYKNNAAIKDQLGISYVTTDYMAGRQHAPLCLTSDRYSNLYSRLGWCGTRGREMMLGTASIHLHVRILDFDEIPVIYNKLCELSVSEGFKMSKNRRDIWNNTDSSRCGLPFIHPENANDSRSLVTELVNFALNAVDLKKNIPYKDLEDLNFRDFLYHLTTIYTDVRPNMKGPTLELRTPDSVSRQEFIPLWKLFVSTFIY